MNKITTEIPEMEGLGELCAILCCVSVCLTPEMTQFIEAELLIP